MKGNRRLGVSGTNGYCIIIIIVVVVAMADTCRDEKPDESQRRTLTDLVRGVDCDLRYISMSCRHETLRSASLSLCLKQVQHFKK